jgi:uncharacterized membrane protein YhaH (DUF805 family)
MKKDTLRIQSHVMLGMLILQYLIGMSANLFIQFPNTTNKKVLWEYAIKQFPISLHIILGILLVIGGIALLIRSIHKRDKNWIWASSVGLLAMLIASFTGSQFISTQQNVYSFIMALTFIFAVFAYGWGIYKTNNKKSTV